jgi:hypothetical protein
MFGWFNKNSNPHSEAVPPNPSTITESDGSCHSTKWFRYQASKKGYRSLLLAIAIRLCLRTNTRERGLEAYHGQGRLTVAAGTRTEVFFQRMRREVSSIRDGPQAAGFRSPKTPQMPGAPQGASVAPNFIDAISFPLIRRR